MTTHTTAPVFQSIRHSRRVSSDNDVTAVPEPREPEAEPAVTESAPKPHILVASKTTGIGDMVARALGQEDEIEVATSSKSPVELLRDDTAGLADYRIVVLEVAPGNDLEMRAVRDLRASVSFETRFLAIVTEGVTLALARTLMDAGVDEVLPLSSVRPELRRTGSEDMASNADASHGGEVRQPGTIIAIAQTRGGIGATTLALNLASLLSAPKGRKAKTPPAKVALLDLDFQNGDAAACIDVEDNGHLIELLKSGELPDTKFVSEAMETYKERFDVLPNPVSFAPFDAMTVEMMTALITELRRKYDYVILDLPRALVRWYEPVLARADQLFMVSDTSVAGIRQARRLIDFFTEDNPGLPIDMVLSKARKPMSLPASLKEAGSFLDRPFDIWLPQDDKAARKAIDLGMPMAEAARRSPVVKALKPVIGKIETLAASNRRREA